MNPSRQPHPLVVERVEWVPASPDEIEVRIYGAWQGGAVPPGVTLVIGNDIFGPLPDPPAPGPPPAWTAAYAVPIDARADVEEGNAAVAGPDFALPLPAGEPGALDPPPGTVVDPAVLAARRARRESAAAPERSAEQAVETLRAQIANLEERAARAVETRDALALRVADAEQRLRLAEQRDPSELEELRGRLAAAQEATTALERELDEAREAAQAESSARAAAEDAAVRAEAEAEALREEARRLAADAESLRGELESVRAGEAADLQALRAELESLRAGEAGSSADLEAVRARAALADDFRAEADSLRAEAESLRAEAESLRARAREAEQLRSEVEILRSRAAMAEDLRARTAALERRLAAEPRRGEAEAEALRARAAELERRLAAERAARVAAEERLAAAGDRPRGDHERALIAQVAALEAELGRRTAIQERVQEAIALIRVELAQVRSQMSAGEGAARAAESAAVADLRAQVSDLEDRGRALDAALRAREVELEGVRSELDRARRDAAAARAEADRRRDELDAAQQDAADLRRRLAAEQEARQQAEQRLAAGGGAQADAPTPPSAPPSAAGATDPAPPSAAPSEAGATDPAPPTAAPSPTGGLDPAPSSTAPATGDDALDTLIAGLREQVAAAREKLEPEGAPPAPQPRGAGPREASRDPAREAADDETRRRLQSIAAELRAAVPEHPAAPGAPGAPGAPDVIGDLQRAAERLRTAAEQELERLESAGAAPGPPAPAPPTGAPAPPAGAPAPPAPAPPTRGLAGPGASGAAVEELGARRGAATAPESDWLRRGLERLSAREPQTAARLLAALLPVQALAVDDLAYDLTSPAVGTLRVVLTGGTARVEPRDRPAIAGHVDATLEGPLDALAPLAAGGTGWRLKGVRVQGSRWRLRRLVRARRAPVTLVDLGRAGSPVHPGLLLSALAAAVEPSWTRGHRFAVAYAIGGDGTFTVVARDGEPLAVLPETPPEAGDLAATVIVSAPAFMPLIAGQAPPEGERAAVAGDRRMVDVLHAWFDTARGVGAQ